MAKKITHNDYNNMALEQFADLLIERMESMKNADWKKPWFTEGFMAEPVNLRGTHYCGINTLMLMFQQEKQQYKIPVWGTFNQFAAMNAEGKEQVSVNKGEKSFPVYHTTFIVIHKTTGEKITLDQLHTMTKEEQENYIIKTKCSVYRVFNISQTNLKEARPEIYAKLESRYAPKQTDGAINHDTFRIAGIDTMLESNSWVCPITQKKQDGAFYSITKDGITVPTIAQFKDNESFYGTLLHEMAHSTGAKGRLGRFDEKNGGFGSESYGMEELVAELTAAFTLSRYGLVKYIKDDSAAYLKSWCKSLKETPDAIKKVLGDVRKASRMIFDHIGIVEELPIDTMNAAA